MYLGRLGLVHPHDSFNIDQLHLRSFERNKASSYHVVNFLLKRRIEKAFKETGWACIGVNCNTSWHDVALVLRRSLTLFDALCSQVGLPKVASCAEHFRAISPTLQVDARDAMFTAEAAEELLLQSATGEVENPRLVVDCNSIL